MSQLQPNSPADSHKFPARVHGSSAQARKSDRVISDIQGGLLPWLQVASAAAVLIYLFCILAFSHTSFPESMRSSSHWPFLMDKPVGEDGYYMLTVAHNIAAKGRIIYNRNAVATGIQPLATFVFAGLDLLIRDKQGASIGLIRAVLLFGGLLFIVFAIQMSRIARRLSTPRFQALAGALAFFLILFDFTLFRLFTYGLETGIYLVCLAACFSATLTIASAGNTSTKQAIWLGIAGGFAGEARIDFGIIFAIILTGLMIRRWMSPLKLLLTGAVALIIVSPWFLYLHRVSGSWMPSSGPAESSPLAAGNLMRRVSSMYPAVVGHLFPWVYGVQSSATMLAATICILAVVASLWSKRRANLLPLTDSIRALLLLWAASFAVLIAIYLGIFDSSQFYYRYAAPIVIISVPLLAVALAQVEALRRHSVAFPGFLMLTFLGWAAISLHSGRIGNRQAVIAGYVLQNFPSTHVGAFQSGVVGYFNPNVENLDGKLNGPALAAAKRHQLPQYIDAEQIDVLVDWPDVIRAELPAAYLAAEWHPCSVPMPVDDALCLARNRTSTAATHSPASAFAMSATLTDTER